MAVATISKSLGRQEHDNQTDREPQLYYITNRRLSTKTKTCTMAANYWCSTQRRFWQFSKEKLGEIRKRLEDDEQSLNQQYPLPEWRLLSIFFREQIAKLARRLQLRQQAQATAQIYVRRFYTKVEVRRTNPYLVLATALYLAGKMEECPQHIRHVANEGRNVWPDFIPADSSKLGECEFSLISEMNSQLIVHHPHRTLSEIGGIVSLSQEEMALAGSVVNDHYLTDLPLLYAPHVIAVMAVFLTVALRPTQTGLVPGTSAATATSAAAKRMGPPTGEGQTKLQKLMGWLADSEVELEAVIDCVQEMLSLYEVWERYNERACKEQIGRFIKARELDK